MLISLMMTILTCAAQSLPSHSTEDVQAEITEGGLKCEIGMTYDKTWILVYS